MDATVSFAPVCGWRGQASKEEEGQKEKELRGGSTFSMQDSCEEDGHCTKICHSTKM